jgi:hypothetical protein
LLTAVETGTTAPGSPKAFTVQEAAQAIAQYCAIDNTLDPSITVTADGSNPTKLPPGISFDNFLTGENLRINMQAMYAPDQTGCLAKRAAFSTKGDECVRKLTDLVNNCNTHTTTQKMGGVLVDNTSHGCVRWSIFGSCTSNSGC